MAILPAAIEVLDLRKTYPGVVALDNVSRLPDWLSDGLCRLSTGGGFSTRALYTDDDEIIFEATKPVIVTGITSVVTRGDLLDRSLVLTLPVITDTARRSEADFWGDFELAKPTLLGALLDAVVVGLGRQRAVKLARTPRMADFAIWISATEPACPWEEGAFMAAYASQCQDVVEVTLDGDIVADTARALAPWAGTATEFLADVNRRATDEQRRRNSELGADQHAAEPCRGHAASRRASHASQ